MSPVLVGPGWAYRVRQAWAHLSARRGAAEEAAVQRTLRPPLRALYARMAPADQRHALRVLAQLESSGPLPAELAQAALLHDVGKATTRLTLLHRTAKVLLQGAAPRLLAWLAAGPAGSWRYPFYVQAQHAELGAQACAAAGADERLVALVRYHEGGLPAPLRGGELERQLAALRAADDRC